MATLTPVSFLENKSFSKDPKAALRRQSECMAQGLPKELDEEKFNLEMDLLKQQETLRIRPALSDHKQRHHVAFIDCEQSSFEQECVQPLKDLANELELKKIALDRASEIIAYLTEQNEAINEKLQEWQRLYAEEIQKQAHLHDKYKKQLQNAEDMIKDLQQRSTKNQSFLGASILAPKSGRYTPLKFYGKQEDDYLAPLSQIQKTIIGKRIEDLQAELRYLSQIISDETENANAVMEQQKYIQDYFEDEVFTTNPCIPPTNLEDAVQNEDALQFYRNIVIQQQRCIKDWEKYANSLKINLIKSLQFIQQMSYQSQAGDLTSTQRSIWHKYDKNQPEIDIKDIVKHISRKVCKMGSSIVEKLREQNNELRQIIEQLIMKMKGSPGQNAGLGKRQQFSNNSSGF